MFSNFKDSFKDSEDDGLPIEIIEAFSNELPDGLKYSLIDKNILGVSSTDGDSMEMLLRVKIPSDFLKVQLANQDELMDLMYRTQTTLEVKKDEPIQINGQEISVTQIFFDLLRDYPQGIKVGIKPPLFGPPIECEISGNGYNKKILLKRQPLADLNRRKFSNEDNGAIHVTFILNEKDHTSSITVNYSVTDTNSIEELVRDLSIALAFCEGEGTFWNAPIPEMNNSPEEIQGLKNSIDYLKKVKELEDALNTKFEFNSNMSVHDEKQIAKLYFAFVNKEAYKEFVKYDSFSVSLTAEKDIQEILEREETFVILSQTEKVNIFGRELELFSVLGFFGFKVIDAVKSEKNENEMDLIIDDLEGQRMYTSVKHFLHREEAVEYMENIKEIKELQDAKELEPI